MVDKHFQDVVIEGNSCYVDEERGYKACCANCGTYHRVSVEEFRFPLVTGTEMLKYTAEMRAWNCCHEGETPIDELPEAPGEWI